MDGLMKIVSCPIFEQAQHAKEAPALICDTRVWSYGAVDEAVSALCHFLQANGVKRGTRIAFVAKPSPQAIFLLFALFRLGAIACPLSFRLPQEQICTYLKTLAISHIFEPESLALGKSQPFDASIDLSLPATLLLTSGSSGSPKAANHTFGAHYHNALGVCSPLGLLPSSRWLLSLPLFHVSGLGILFRCFLSGAAVVLSSLPLLDATFKFQISHLSLVPTQLHRLLQENIQAPSLKCLLLGGAPISAELLHSAQEKGLPVRTTYGLTEMASMVTLSGETQLPFREFKIDGRTQEIWVRGNTLFEGYWSNQEQKVAKIEADAWHPTKDLGKLNDVGELEIIGRKDRQFISGGENIQPEEIEKALCNIPGVLQASVLPIDDKEFGQRPVAFIHTVEAHTLQSIREALLSVLPSFKHPVAIYPYPEEVGLKPSLSVLKQSLPHSMT
jgi:O-succinylbenzoic acid--CoA ligase